MAKIEFPKPLRDLLVDSDLEAPLRSLADRTGEILSDNKLPFFPDYTDHGTEHINRVLKAEVELVPKNVWENSSAQSDPRLLCDADAAVIIGGTLLHDIAMHLRPHGFLELVNDSRFKPLSWFADGHEDYAADRPWVDLWEDFLREARRFSDRALTNIIGEESARVWKFEELPADTGQWETNHCLVVGEFIRRHHGRLAHEIAIYGFPGIPTGSGEGQFPAMGKEEGHPLMGLADLIGLSARSHGMSLRVCKGYLESSPLYPGTPKPMGTAVLYPMALLRVADYLQIDRQRAPPVLLKLRNPQNPISVQEWQKHRAVQNIGPATDPRGKMVTVSTNLSLSLYLQLRDLLNGLQSEMDHSTAVLDETYGTLTELGLHQLNLATRRVHSNLNSPAFRASLPYVPEATGFTADPNILTLLVEPLYGKEPSVGMRELIQNSIDAVAELHAWALAQSKPIESLDLPQQDGDVLIEFIKREDASWVLRVRDRGIGMTSDTIEKYFLRAGASFRRSATWTKEFLNEQGQPKIIRAGRFGIGVFSVFLLGPSFRMWSRHAGADESQGYMIEAVAHSQLIEIRRRTGLPFGTTIEVELNNEAVFRLNLEQQKGSLPLPNAYHQMDWFCWDWPKITKVIERDGKKETLSQEYRLPISEIASHPEWSTIYPEGFDAVYWTFVNSPLLVCNGIRIASPAYFSQGRYGWPRNDALKAPKISIVDSAANLPLTTQRYELSQPVAPFIRDLRRDVMLSFIAHALVCGPLSFREALSNRPAHPLRKSTLSSLTRHETTRFSEGRLRWCSSHNEVVPADEWLYSLLTTKKCVVYGVVSPKEPAPPFDASVAAAFQAESAKEDLAVLPWHHVVSRDKTGKSIHLPAEMLQEIIFRGVSALGHIVEAAKVLVSATRDFPFESYLPWDTSHDDPELHERPNFWRHVTGLNPSRNWFEAEQGNPAKGVSLSTLLGIMERNVRAKPYYRSETLPSVLYVCEIATVPSSPLAESLIAKTWNECLGPKAIPFDPAARAALISEASRHPELKRHIDNWQQMKRSGSEWTEVGS